MSLIKKIKKLISEKQISFGESVWRKLDEDLPRAMGVLKDDEERITLFKQKVKLISKKELKALNAFLQSRLYYYENEWPEHTCASSENHFRKWRQIYNQHLEALS